MRKEKKDRDCNKEWEKERDRKNINSLKKDIKNILEFEKYSVTIEANI